jgi:hypothetical protein
LGRAEVKWSRIGYDRHLRPKSNGLIHSGKALIGLLRKHSPFFTAQDPYIRMGKKFPGQAQMKLANATQTYDKDTTN